MIKKHDIKGDGVLSFEEFKCIFMGDPDGELDDDPEAPWKSHGREGP